MRGRPGLVTRYSRDMAILPTTTGILWFGALVVELLLLGLNLPADLALLGATRGYRCGWCHRLEPRHRMDQEQVSLDKAFFLGVGAFTAAVLNGRSGRSSRWYRACRCGYGFRRPVIMAAIAGLLVSPLAFRLRGSYLAFVTLGLVFIGEHILREAKPLTGGQGVGRAAPEPVLFALDLGSKIVRCWLYS